jgi:hypothetical protein
MRTVFLGVGKRAGFLRWSRAALMAETSRPASAFQALSALSSGQPPQIVKLTHEVLDELCSGRPTQMTCPPAVKEALIKFLEWIAGEEIKREVAQAALSGILNAQAQEVY